MDINNESIKDKALQSLAENKGRYREICRDTGLDYSWINKLSQGCIDDPGVLKIERLNKWFARDLVRSKEVLV